MNTPPYGVNDLLQMLGQCTVELAWLRSRVAQLEAELAAPSSNGQAAEAEVIDDVLGATG